MTIVEAHQEAAAILKDEANELALMATEKVKWDSIPHRAKVAIQREIQRLRLIADTLKGD